MTAVVTLTRKKESHGVAALPVGIGVANVRNVGAAVPPSDANNPSLTDIEMSDGTVITVRSDLTTTIAALNT